MLYLQVCILLNCVKPKHDVIFACLLYHSTSLLTGIYQIRLQEENKRKQPSINVATENLHISP